MKSKLSYIAAAVLFLALGAYTGYASVHSTDTHQTSESRQETFTGKVTMNSDNRDFSYEYILYDEVRKMNYFLDDSGKARDFDQKRVAIKGTLDQRNFAIHVDSIKELD